MPGLLKLNLQFFSDEGTDQTTDTGTQTEGTQQAALTMEQVQEMINKTVQSETDKVRTEYSKKLKDKEKEVEDLRTASMTAEEKAKHELEQAQREVQEQKKALQERENKLFAIDELVKAEMPASFLSFVTASSDEDTTAKIAALKSEFDKAVAAKVEETFKSTGRKFTKGNDNTGTTNPWSKESFNLTEQGRLYREDKAKAIALAAEHGITLQ